MDRESSVVEYVDQNNVSGWGIYSVWMEALYQENIILSAGMQKIERKT